MKPASKRVSSSEGASVLPFTLMVITLVLIYQVKIVNSYATFVPITACINFIPSGHINTQGNVPTTQTSSVYSINIGSVISYNPGTSYSVTLSGNQNFNGFIIQAVLDGTTTPVGTFSSLPSGVQYLACGGVSDTVTHSSGNDKNNLVLTWTAPADNVGTVVFRATFVRTQLVFWTGIRSATITGPGGTRTDIVTTIAVLLSGTIGIIAIVFAVGYSLNWIPR